MRHRLAPRSGMAFTALAALVVAAFPAAAAEQSIHADPAITIDGAAKSGRVFNGVGAISGGGGTARLLIDYPEPERSQILDYLFKPGYGANVQVLKLEIGGDAEATDAAEPSFEHSRGHINCTAGYEIWLAQQAVLRNKNILLYALQWNAPGWVGGGQENPWTQADIGYLMRWMGCAKQAGLHIGYLGGWNEHQLANGVTPAIMQWFIDLRAALNSRGYSSTKIVALDTHVYSCCDFARLLASHPRFSRAIGVLGYHDICKYPTTGKACFVPRSARDSGKPIWATEIGALRPPGGSAAFARTINLAWIEAKATAILEYPLVNSMPGGMPEEDRGLVIASQPWTGYYVVPLTAWVAAQTSQFTQSGWVHVAGASGQFGGSYGTYSAYEGPGRKAWSLVAQTSDALAAQTITVNIKGTLPATVVHVWSTNLRSPDPTQWLVQQPDITPTSGTFQATLKPGYVYTFTTTSGQSPGCTAIVTTGCVPRAGQAPSATAMPLPWSTTPSGTTFPQSAFGPDGAGMPWGLEPADGSFEYPKGVTSYFVQTTAGRPDFWQPPKRSMIRRFPYAVVGDYCLGAVPITKGTAVPADCGTAPKADYTISATVRFTGAGQSAGVIARYYRPVTTPIQYFYGYRFTVSTTGHWQVVKDNLLSAPVTLASGTYRTALGTHIRHVLSLTVLGSTLTAAIDAHPVKRLTDRSHGNGVAGICTGGWYPVHFINVTVSP